MSDFIDTFLGGITCTIFLYGQTGSGKTFTLLGPPQFQLSTDYSCWGICPRFMSQAVEKAQNDESYNFSVSAVEIYFQDGYDLLNKKAKVQISGMSS